MTTEDTSTGRRGADAERFRREMKMGTVAATVERRRALDPAACTELAALLEGLQLEEEQVDPGRLALTVRRLEGLDLAALEAMRDLLVAVAWWFHNEIHDRESGARWAGDEPPAA